MEIRRVRIENFRCIKHLNLPLSSTTILVGANNAGKTAILDALRIALGRRWGTRGTGFTEYDIHLPDDGADPKQCGQAVIEIEFGERVAGEWPAAVQDDLISIIQPDDENRSMITLRVSCGWDDAKNAYEPTWAFLNAAMEPMRGSQARVTNAHPLFQYAPIFYMSALRDSGDEFTSRSQFWGRLLKAIIVPEHVEARVKRVLDLVNTQILAIYRGDSFDSRRRRTYGLGWSSSREVADGFAQGPWRAYQGGSVLLEGDAPANAIICAPCWTNNRYGEHEYVVDRRLLRNVRVLARYQ